LSESQFLVIFDTEKLSSGKSTFLNAACSTDAKVSELPFTTIDPNKGISYVKTQCICQSLNVEDDPQNSTCIDGKRFIPINLLDVAGLVPDAHKGRGLGNKFLNDLSKADMLLHIVDITGSLDKNGKRTAEGENDPYEDIVFLEKEINLWFKDILERDDWNRFTKSFMRQKSKIVEELHNRLSGVKINKFHITEGLKNANLEGKNPSEWTDEELMNFVKKLRQFSKPILIIANKIDKEIGVGNLDKLKQKYKGTIIPCSALAEYMLKRYADQKTIKYLPGSRDFEIIEKKNLKPKEIETLNKIKEKILSVFGGTGVQKILNHVVFTILEQICVYPVSDVNTLTDNNNNILPDVFLVKKGTHLKDFVRDKIHSDLATNFMFGIDVKTKKRLGENYELQHNDVIKIVSK
jgi:ribosome-binding ATPase YchF (GTP1/OBG family)